MTICLAALCRQHDQPVAVVAADRMVTMGGFIEFEHPVPKMAQPSPLAVVMVAGDTLVGTRMAQEVSGALYGTSPRVLDIAQRLAMQYQAMRQQALESQILGPRGLSLASFYGGHASFNPQITMMLDQQMSQFNFGVELLLSGVDDGGAHIFSVHNPGPSELQHDVIGYAAIGSGAIHAVQSMIGFGHSAAAGVPETIFRVYASKRRAEVAPGVGQDTDLGIISADGIGWLSDEQIKILAQLYEEARTAAATDLAGKLAELDLSGRPTEDGADAPGDDGGARDRPTGDRS